MKRCLTGAVGVCCVAACVSPALAQTSTGSGRPFGGLFGARSERTGGHNLELTATLVQAYDDNLLAESGGISAGTNLVGGQYSMLQAGTQYKWAGRSVQLGINGSSAFRYYGQVGDVQTVSHAAAAGLSATLARRTSVLINQSVAYSPSYLFGLFPAVSGPEPGATQPTAPDYAVNDLASYSYVTSAAVSHGLTRRVSLAASANYTFTDFSREENGRRDVTAYGASTDLARGIGRHTDLRVGYRYRTGGFGSTGSASTTEHALDVGMNHRKILSASRQAHFGFGLGMSATNTPDDISPTGQPGPIVSPGQLYRVVGNATVGYEFARSWQARAAYRQGLEYVADLTEPVFVGGFTATVDGLLTRRADLQASAGYSSGKSALSEVTTFDTFTASLRSRLALTRAAAVYLEYLYFFYEFSGSPLLVGGSSPRLERHGLRGGLTLWVPAFRR
ncbi:MAG: hypothetical protein ABIS06_04885 [Vicinamibacterales bacterium]